MTTAKSLQITTLSFVATAAMFYFVEKGVHALSVSRMPSTAGATEKAAADQYSQAGPELPIAAVAASSQAPLTEPIKSSQPVPRAVARPKSRSTGSLDKAASPAPQTTQRDVEQMRPIRPQLTEPEPVPESRSTNMTGRTVRIKAGTKIQVTIAKRIALTAGDSHGGTFTGSLNKAIRVEDQTVADKGSAVAGRYAPMVGGNGNIVVELELLSVRTAHGTTLSIETASKSRGGGKKSLGKVLGTVGVVATTVFVPAASSVAMSTIPNALNRGSDSVRRPASPVIAGGTKLSFKLSQDVYHDLR